MGLLVLSIALVVSSAHAWMRCADVVDEGLAASSFGRPGGLYIETDTYYWLGYAEDRLRDGAWRTRWTHRDNPPDGRPVHWAQPYLWLLLLAGKATSLATGLGPREALERGAYAVNPILEIALMIGAVFLLWRRLGPSGAGLFALGLAGLRDVRWVFLPLRPDHQALYVACAVLSVAALLAGGLGWTDGSTRRWRTGCFVVSGVCAGVGLWVSAATQAAALYALVAAVVGTRVLIGARDDGYDPGLWRLFGLVGAATSLCGFLLEYAPSRPGMRLEVNHPLHAIAIAGVGEGLRLVTGRWWRRLPWTAARGIAGAAAVSAAAALPALMMFGPSSWHALRDPGMRRLHGFIAEFGALPALTNWAAAGLLASSYGLFLLALPAALLAARSETVGRSHRAAAGFMAAFVAVFLLLACGLHVRWLALLAPFVALLAAVVASLPGRLALVLGAALAVQTTAFVRSDRAETGPMLAGTSVRADLIDSAGKKYTALALGRLRAGRPWRFVAHPDLAPALHYFAGIPCAASLYWENADGLRAAATFFADETEDATAARAVADRRGWTHVMIPESGETSRLFVAVGSGAGDSGAAARSLVGRLERGAPLPPWVAAAHDLETVARAARLYRGTPFAARLKVFRLFPPG